MNLYVLLGGGSLLTLSHFIAYQWGGADVRAEIAEQVIEETAEEVTEIADRQQEERARVQQAEQDNEPLRREADARQDMLVEAAARDVDAADVPTDPVVGLRMCEYAAAQNARILGGVGAVPGSAADSATCQDAPSPRATDPR